MDIKNNLNIDGNLTVRGTSATITSAGNAQFQSISATALYDTNFVGAKALISNADKSLGESSVTSSELGYVSGVTSSIQTQLNSKEGTLTSGTTSQYYRGDKTWQTLNTSIVPELTNLYYTNARVKTYADTLYLPITGIDASKITSGTIDPARIPVLPSQVPQVTTNIPSLTLAQQNTITSGTIVTTSDDGFRYVYSGTGSKTTSASYVVLADITPEWSAVSNRPTNVSYWTNDSGYLTTTTGDARYSLTTHNHNGLYLTSTSALNPANVTQTSAYRFVTDSEKTTWNNKQNGSSVLTSVAALSTGTGLLKLTNGVASLDTNTYATTTQLGSYLPLSGGTMSGKLTLAPSTSSYSSFNIPVAVSAPSTPLSGDVWGSAYSVVVYDRGLASFRTDSDTYAVGPRLELSNIAGTKGWGLQLGASNDLAFWNYNGSWARKIQFFQDGSAKFAANISIGSNAVWHAGNFTPGNYLPLAGGEMIGSIISSGIKHQFAKNVTPSTSANTNYREAPLEILRVSASSSDLTTHAGIGFHNPGVNAAFLFYDAGTAEFRFNRDIAGSINTLWNTGNLTFGTGHSNMAYGDHVHSGVYRLNASPVSGNWWNGTPYVLADGVMEIGRIIDFHSSSASTSDFDVRLFATGNALDITASSGVTVNGNTVWHSGNFTGTQNGHNHSDVYQPIGSYVTLDTTQTISGAKTFSSTPTLNSGINVYTGTRTMTVRCGANDVQFKDSVYSTIIANIDLVNAVFYANKLSAAYVNSSLIPFGTGSYDLGSLSFWWKSIYVSYILSTEVKTDNVITDGLQFNHVEYTASGSNQINLQPSYFEFNSPDSSTTVGVMPSSAPAGSIMIIKGRAYGSPRATAIIDTSRAIKAIDGSTLVPTAVEFPITGIMKFIKTIAGNWQEF